ncbi:MAG TPA: hypothetical protein VM327_03975 [Candidatus Thermoplasmatota archaeon]|nr:hypothetical protein [Candidatus Thermoplasmatota archaeon]
MVLEAILVALLVLTAILFFTSLQRPTTGGDQGGLDLGQVSADTLQILQVRQFNGQTLEGWVTNLTRGDAATATSVDSFIRQVLPTGARYSLRLDNGVSALQILPVGAAEGPRGARGAEIMLLPNWANYRNATLTTFAFAVYPGQVIDSGNTTYYALVNPASTSYLCLKAPNASATMPAINGGHRMVRDGAVTSASATVTSATAAFSASDVGRGVTGTGIPKSARILTVNSATSVTLNATATATGTATTLSIVDDWSHHWRATPSTSQSFKVMAGQVPIDIPLGKWETYATAACTGTPAIVNVVSPECAATPMMAGCSSPFTTYGLQLVVWFGA